jgi:hypothetical protein
VEQRFQRCVKGFVFSAASAAAVPAFDFFRNLLGSQNLLSQAACSKLANLRRFG